MKKDFLKKYLLIFSFLIIIPVEIYVFACGIFYNDDYYDSNSMFAPEAFVDKSYSPLFYDLGNLFYYNPGSDYEFCYQYINNRISLHDEDIVAQWKEYLGVKVSQEAVSAYLLTDTIMPFVKAIGNREHAKLPFKLDLKDPKIEKFLTFISTAKKVERYSKAEVCSWDYNSNKIIEANPDLVNEVVQLYNKEKRSSTDEFYLNRLWFQVAKAKFYSTDKSSVIAFFDETSSAQPKNMLYYRALGYSAGAYYKQKKYNESNYRFAQIFNDIPSLRTEAVYNFKPQNNTDLAKTLNLTDDVNIKSAIYAINGYYGDEISAMKNIYSVNPKSEHLDFLLTRWINKQETEVNILNNERIGEYYEIVPFFKVNSLKEYRDKVKTKIDTSTYTWIKKVIENPEKLHNPGLWFACSGYISMLEGKHKKAAELFSQALNQSKESALLQEQIRLLKLANKINALDRIDSKIENELVSELNWLYFDKKVNSNYFRKSYIHSFIRQLFSYFYAENKNIVMQEVFLNDKSFYTNASNSIELEKFLLKENKTPWESFAQRIYSYKLDDLYDSQAIYFFYENKIDEAIEKMEKSIAAKTKLKANPFNGFIPDCHYCEHNQKQKKIYTKISFLKKVKELQDNLAKGKDLYNNALLLGNAFYSASHFGNARLFYDNDIIAEWSHYVADYNKPFLCGMGNAKKYYQIALSAATNDEQRAKAWYMLAKVERNEYYQSPEPNIDFKPWTGFKKLKEHYANTKYYNDVIQECGYFRKYLGIKNN